MDNQYERSQIHLLRIILNLNVPPSKKDEAKRLSNCKITCLHIDFVLQYVNSQIVSARKKAEKMDQKVAVYLH